MQNSFLNRIITELLSQTRDLSQFTIVLPGKRPVVFIKRILAEQKYSGLLPDFLTIEELIQKIAGQQQIQGIALWLFAFDVYRNIYEEDFSNFLKWFPTLLKDWDDILKFADDEREVLDYMFAEERIKNWGENLGEHTETRKRNLDFWRKMNVFLPELKKKLHEKGWATSGMIHKSARENLENFTQNTQDKLVFCGFNAFTPVEESLVRNLLQWGKAQCFFQADQYYIQDERQEAGKFLRKHLNWKEFNENRNFKWIDAEFSQPKNIKVFEVSGNITQTKVLPEIFKDIQSENLSDTAVVLLDENLLPASLDALNSVENLNITMGFPLKNLAFSNAVKHIFYIQKQLEKNTGSYYYNDILAVLEALPNDEGDAEIISKFNAEITERNMVYLSASRLQEMLGNLSYFELFQKAENALQYLDLLVKFCLELKFKNLDDIQFENISHFEKSFRIIKNQISTYTFPIKMETLEVLINNLVNTETIDFMGEPLQGLQIMGLLETRLLNFKNVIMLSVNEGKLPLGNSQNTYLPFDVREKHNLHTFLENDSIYAYHFYRLIQESENVYLMYNALTSGVNTGEKSRFITQLEMESPHRIEEIIIENTSEPVDAQPIKIVKTSAVLERLGEWKESVSASHLTGYLYDPVQFYLNYVLKTRESDEIEEELSQRNYGNLVHFSLQVLYERIKGKVLTEKDLHDLITQIDEALNISIEKLKHQPEFYQRGMNFVHKSIAKRVVENIIQQDLKLVKAGNRLEIIELEKEFENLEFFLDDDKTDSVKFRGFVDRIDRLNGTLRVIDYKTGKAKNLNLTFVARGNDKTETLLMDDKFKQALQLCIYLYYIQNQTDLKISQVEAGIWSFAEVNSGVQVLNFNDGDLQAAMISIKNLILDILNPEKAFEEKLKADFEF
ncbi:PD-(D/E)XK nuclease family protein [Chryseobacterium taklimakanense]|uniref:PD-(D/E)XK nuclease family protein n=1 Tax=Chryseobacterium taklimakanense TaxID=536441 RepID=UPI0023F8EFFD|nr:PD-(D/E)XK nuclease family protein [Chryseobacterium taklimakanense]